MEREKILVIDFEFTCWRGRPPKGMSQEILEIGLAEVDLVNGKILNRDSIIIKPESSVVSKFCTKLTTITNEQVEKSGIILSDAFNLLNKKYDLQNICWGSWGKFDKTHLSKECKSKNIDFPFSKDYVDIQKHFSKTKKDKSRLYSVENALKELGTEFKGTPHRADVDAYNTAIIYLSMYRE
jgi:inhibitor of KinA sporulation pathway (predicted exonuclease)